MQTLFSANQSVRTILVILLKKMLLALKGMERRNHNSQGLCTYMYIKAKLHMSSINLWEIIILTLLFQILTLTLPVIGKS